jgi:hypothetical protein
MDVTPTETLCRYMAFFGDYYNTSPDPFGNPLGPVAMHALAGDGRLRRYGISATLETQFFSILFATALKIAR